MRKISLTISGCMGRMGQQLIKSAYKNKNFKLVSLTENRKISRKIFGIKPEINSINAFKKSNVIIDFTTPKCTLEILKIAAKLKKKVIIGTTGFTKKEENLIKKFSKRQKEILEEFNELETNKPDPVIKNFFEKAKRFWKKT